MKQEALQAALAALSARPIIVASHRRSGTHLTIDFLRRQFVECRSWKLPGERLDRLYVNIDRIAAPAYALRILRRVPRPIMKTHSRSGFEPWCREREQDPELRPWAEFLARHARCCYLVRDGRAVMCSLHRYRGDFDPDARVPISRFMRQPDEETGVSRPKAWAMHVAACMNDPGIVILPFERMVREPRAQMDVLAERLGLTPRRVEPPLPKRAANRLALRWARLTAVRPQTTAVGSSLQRIRHVQKWTDAFSEEDRAFFHQEAGDMLIRLGYVQSDQWVTRPPPAAAGRA